MRLWVLSILHLVQFSPHDLHFLLQWCNISTASKAVIHVPQKSLSPKAPPGFSFGRELCSWGQLSTALALTVQQHHWAKSSALAQSLFWACLPLLINKEQDRANKGEQKQSLPFLWTMHEIIATSPSLKAFWCYLNKNNYPNCSL